MARDDAKRLILARRARFVAAALAGMTIACGKETVPQPCLEPPPANDDASAPPQPCLSEALPDPPPVGSIDAAPSDAGVVDAARTALPNPKSKPAPTPAPPDAAVLDAPAQPCLTDSTGIKRYKKERL